MSLGSSEVVPGACLDEETVLALVGDQLAGAARAAAERHLDECPECRTLVSELLRPVAAAPAAPVAPPGGPAIGPYRLDHVLGEGGMGTVWAAHHAATGRAVALKVLKGDSPELAERLLREARVAGALTHPNIVRVEEVIELGAGSPVLVMELLEGETLARRLARAGALPFAEVAALMMPVISALGHAHGAGVVHRDLTPANIYLAAGAGAPPAVKVLDFGIAKVTSSEQTVRRLSVTGAMLGTPFYMSPEQIFGRATIDHRADIWALGVIVHEALAGRRPFVGENLGQLVYAITAGHVPTLHAAPRPIARLVHRMLARDPARRPRDLREVAALFARYARTEAPPVPAPSPALLAAAVARPRRPRRWLALGAVALLAAGVAAAVLAAGPWGRAPRGAAPGPRALPVTELPLPASASAAARDALAAARQAERDGEATASVATAYERVTKLDPGLAIAWIQVAEFRHWTLQDDTRQAVKQARLHRAGLSPRDELLLLAVEPYLKFPYDLAGRARVLERATSAHPLDAQLWDWLGRTRMDTGEMDQAVAAFDRAVALDPRYGGAIAHRAEALLYLGRFAEALAEAARVLAVSATVEQAWLTRMTLFEGLGECGQLEEDARRWIATGSTTAAPHVFHARALVARGASDASVAAVLTQQQARLAASLQPRRGLLDAARLALLRGDFAGARERLQELSRLVQRDATERWHAHVARHLVELHEEIGDSRAAVAVAEEHLQRREAWLRLGSSDDHAAGEDITLRLHAALHRARRIDDAEFTRRREAWLAAWTRRTPSRFYRSYLWFWGWAEPARTPVEARAALAALPAFAPLPPFRPGTLADGAEGRAYLLGGRVKEGISRLTSASRSCLALADPVGHTQAYYWLGQAREAAGDPRGACDAYATVLARWGHAQPPSVTAARARARARTLGCAP
ncbi:MAG TPA: protein kinase [Polyangia bacterium]|jgi:serine/threonine-protein kinase